MPAKQIIKALLLFCLMIFRSSLYAATKDQVISELGFVKDVVRAAHPAYALNDEYFLKVHSESFDNAIELTQNLVPGDSLVPYIQNYLTAFRDPHLSYTNGDTTAREPMWLGWIVKWGSKGYTVSHVKLPSKYSAPAVGALLVSCDGISVETLLHDMIAPFIDRRVELRGSREIIAKSLSAKDVRLDLPQYIRPKSCVFEHEGELRHYLLRWMPLHADEAKLFSSQSAEKVSVKLIEGSLVWMSVSSLLMTDQEFSDAIYGLEKYERKLPMVLDLRNNTGGNSMVGARILSALRHSGQKLVSVDTHRAYWRVSDYGVAALRARLTYLSSVGLKDSSSTDWIKTMYSLMVSAQKNGKPWLEQPRFAGNANQILPNTDGHEILRRIYVLTDRHCVSACLDLVRAMKKSRDVYQIGEPTSAGSKYNDVASVTTPAGHILSFPLKYWKSTDRLDEPIIPDFTFSFDSQNTKEVISWVLNEEKKRHW